MTEYTIDNETLIAAVTAATEFGAYDAGVTNRYHKANAAQVATFVRSTIEGDMEVVTPITTVGAGTLTAAALAGGIVTRSGSTSAFSDATDTAANIIAALPSGTPVNFSWDIKIVNLTAFAETITAGSGVTLAGVTSTPVIPGNSTGFFTGLYTGAGAVTLECTSVAYNAATGSDPSNVTTFFGGGTGAFTEEGNLNVQISSAGVSPGATAADNVLAVYSIPASSFSAANKGINISAQGSFAATSNNKTLKIIFNPSTAVVGSTVGTGGTTIATTGVVTTSGAGWNIAASVFKYGAAGSNTQLGVHQAAQVGAAVSALTAPQLCTATESGAILIAITGNAATATTDILLNFLQISAFN